MEIEEKKEEQRDRRDDDGSEALMKSLLDLSEVVVVDETQGREIDGGLEWDDEEVGEDELDQHQHGSISRKQVLHLLVARHIICLQAHRI